MPTVQLADRLGNLKKKHVGFSWQFFCLGPLYLLFTWHIWLFLGSCILIYYFTPIPGMEQINAWLISLPLPKIITSNLSPILLKFRGTRWKYVGIGIYIIIHTIASFYVSGRVVARPIRKRKYLPLTENDARTLVYYHAAKPDVPLADSFNIRAMSGYKSAEQNWYEANQNRLMGFNNVETSTHYINSVTSLPKKITQSEMSKIEKAQGQLEELQNLYNSGLITREQYDFRRKRILDNK